MNHTKHLPYYGIHEEENGVAYLFQDTCPYGWEFIGANTKSSMSVRQLNNKCPHSINVHLANRNVSKKQWNTFLKIANDPLVQAMLPIINGRAYFFDQSQMDNATHWLACLERMSNPFHVSVVPMWQHSSKIKHKMLGVTNIHPLVFTNIKPDDVLEARQLAESSVSNPRTLILAGEGSLILPKLVRNLETRLQELISFEELVSLPLEHIGAYIVGEYCKGSLNLDVA